MGDLATVKNLENPVELSPKLLLSPTAGPYSILQIRDHKVQLSTNAGDVWFNWGRLTKAPFPEGFQVDVSYLRDIEKEISFLKSQDHENLDIEARFYDEQTTQKAEEDVCVVDDIVIDRPVGYRYDSQSEIFVKVRWYALSPTEDT